MKINYLETRAAKVCLSFTAPHTQNRKGVNWISFLNRGYAFNCLVAVCLSHDMRKPVIRSFQLGVSLIGLCSHRKHFKHYMYCTAVDDNPHDVSYFILSYACTVESYNWSIPGIIAGYTLGFQNSTWDLHVNHARIQKFS